MSGPTKNPKKPLLEVRGLALTRFRDDQPTLDLEGINLTLQPGELSLLQGPSGIGKSSLLMALGRIIPSRSDHLTLDHSAAQTYPPSEWRIRVHYLPAQPEMVAGSVWQNLTLP